MWPYVAIIAIPALFQHFRVERSRLIVTRENPSSFSMKLFWMLLLLMLMLRSTSIGIDLKNYEYIFDYTSQNDWAQSLGRSNEVGWNFLNKLIAALGGSFRWVIVISGILSIWWLSRAYVKYSNDTLLSVALFVSLPCFVFLFSGLRQSVAISIGFIAFECVRKKKPIYFLIAVLVAMTFHTSAFMLLFMYPLYYVRVKKNWLIWIIPILVLIYVFNVQIFTALGLLLSQFTDYDTTITLTGSITALILFVMFAVIAFLLPDEAKLDADTIGMRNFLLLTVVLQMFAPLHTIAMRMNYYYIAFVPILIPRIIQYRSNRWEQVAVLARHVMVIFFVAYFFLTAPADNLLNTFPYQFMWQN